MSHAVAFAQPANVPAAPIQGQAAPAPKASDSGFTFHDFLNIINPLQHIPVVATIYREVTGDTIKPISNILGGALFGGVIGLASSAVDSIVQEVTGKDIGAHVLATLGLEDGPASNPNVNHQIAASHAKPVPAFLVAEAAADRSAHANTAPVGVAQPTSFWLSLQRGGAGVTHGPAGRPVITIGPPKPAAGGGQTGGGAIGLQAAAQPILKAAADGTPIVVSSQQSAPRPANPGAPQPIIPTANGVQPLPKAQIPEMMMEALAKYQAMQKAQQAQAVDQTH